MSLFILGSASRVTSNIITQLAKTGQYSSITLSDLLPLYDNYHRYYRLQKDLDNLQLNNFNFQIEKLFSQNQLASINKYDDVLYVTHDYYSHVTSKTKLMKLFAQVCSKRNNLYFATPIEYDHYGFANPQANYNEAEQNVLQIAPQSTIIRSDIQDKTQTFAYINSRKGFLDSQCFNMSANKNFAPKVASSYHYANVVAQTMKDRAQGKRIYVSGEKELRCNEVDYETGIESHQFEHAKQNITKLTANYNDVVFGSYEQVQGQ